MAEPTPIGGARIRKFEDLASAHVELLRQIASRVHIIDLAYALANADEALRDRLFGAVRPGLADQIRQAILTVTASPAATRFPPEEHERSSRAQVLQIAKSLQSDEW